MRILRGVLGRQASNAWILPPSAPVILPLILALFLFLPLTQVDRRLGLPHKRDPDLSAIVPKLGTEWYVRVVDEGGQPGGFEPVGPGDF